MRISLKASSTVPKETVRGKGACLPCRDHSGALQYSKRYRRYRCYRCKVTGAQSFHPRGSRRAPSHSPRESKATDPQAHLPSGHPMAQGQTRRGGWGSPPTRVGAPKVPAPAGAPGRSTAPSRRSPARWPSRQVRPRARAPRPVVPGAGHRNSYRCWRPG